MNSQTEQIFILNPSQNQSPSDQQKLAEIPETAQVNLENVEDFNNVCRICATVTEFVIPIFSGEGLQNNLADKIHKHLPIQVSEQDTLPRAVCYQCASTLLAWHELVQCCAHADAAMRTRTESKTINVEAGESTETEQQTKWNTTDITLRNETVAQITKHHDGEAYGSEPHEDNSSLDDDDEPLSAVATKKSHGLYNAFYAALVRFRNHFATKHKARDTCPGFTDSGDSEVGDANDEEPQDYFDSDGGARAGGSDDLTLSNMRRDRMDDETRSELSRVRRKINGKVVYACALCGKTLSSTHTYLFHKRIHTGERPCVCHVCGKQFRAPNGLQRHLTETHDKLRRYSCRLCAKTFANSQNMKQHMRIHTGERPFVCPQCGKRFTQSGSLHVHLKTHSGQFPHDCAECGAKFRLRSGLVRHKLVHTGERPHACPHCGKGFRQRHELNSHVISHTDAKPHSCALCGAAFKQRRALRHHTKKTHENNYPHGEVTHEPAYGQIGHYQ